MTDPTDTENADTEPAETDPLTVPDNEPVQGRDVADDPARVELQDELASIREVGEGRRGND